MLTQEQKNTQFDLILPKMTYSSHEEVFKDCAQHMSQHTGIPAEHLFKGLTSKIRFSRSLVGEGLVMSDMRVQSLSRPFLALVTLDKPLDFGAPDKMPIHTISFLLSPAKEGNMHLSRVFRLSRLLKKAETKILLAEADDEETIRARLNHPEGWMIAA